MDKFDWLNLILNIINTILALLAYLNQFGTKKAVRNTASNALSSIY